MNLPCWMCAQGRVGEGEIDFEDGFGMTTARQAEVRGALFSMLGSAEGGNVRRNTAEDSRAPESAQSHRQQSPGEGASTMEPWSCSVCTLINSADSVLCRACGCAHMSE